MKDGERRGKNNDKRQREEVKTMLKDGQRRGKNNDKRWRGKR